MSGAANDVSNPHEPSYYEIALTNRQVIVAFVIILLCLVGAFFSGVWIGRENGARAAAEQMVRNAPPPEEEKKEGQNLEEFEFFDSGKNGKNAKNKNGKPGKGETKPPEPAPVQAAPEPAAAPVRQPAPAGTDSTLAEDLGADTEAAPRNPPPAAAAPAPTPAPATKAQRQKPGAKPAAERVAATDPKPVPPASRAAKRAADSGAGAEPPHAAGQVVIQVFSSAEKDQAERIRDRLVSGGQKAYLSPVEVAGRTMYRVRIGPFGSRDKAQKTAEQVRKGYKLDTWVTE